MLRFITTIIVALAAFSAQAAVDVNKATQADLEALRGVGPTLSGKILEARKAGEFRHWADLVERVHGVGPASAARLSKAGLTVAGAPYEAQAAAPKARAAKAASAPAQAKGGKPEKIRKAEGSGPEKAR
jgi:competence protein ComEA